MSAPLYTNQAALKRFSPKVMLLRVSDINASKQCLALLEQTHDLLVHFCNWQRLVFGLLCFMATAGLIPRTVSDISKFLDVSRKSLYKDMQYARFVLQSLQEIIIFSYQCIHPNKDTVDHAILLLRMEGRCTLESIHRLLPQMLSSVAKRSIGYISKVISRYSDVAEGINKETDYSKVRQVANDEIFDAGNHPVLTGVDLESTCVYLMSRQNDRTSETWVKNLAELKGQKLCPDVAISDAAGSILKSVKMAYPEVSVRLDTFHSIRSLSIAFYSYERHVYKVINGCYEAEKKLMRKKYTWRDDYKKAKSDCKKLQEELQATMKDYEIIECLYGWVKEHITHNGYFMEDTHELLCWCLDELIDYAIKSHAFKLCDEAVRMKERLSYLLAFLGSLPSIFDSIASEMSIPVEAIRLLYQRLSTAPGTVSYKDLTSQVIDIVGIERLRELEHTRNCAMYKNQKASSFIENVNSRVRPYMDEMKGLKSNFYHLLQFYFNNKRYRRSRIPERIGKSPMELLTKSARPEFIGVLQERGYLLDTYLGG